MKRAVSDGGSSPMLQFLFIHMYRGGGIDRSLFDGKRSSIGRSSVLPVPPATSTCLAGRSQRDRRGGNAMSAFRFLYGIVRPSVLFEIFFTPQALSETAGLDKPPVCGSGRATDGYI